MERKFNIALALPGRIALFERTLQGIMKYARQRGGWIFAMNPEQRHDTMSDLSGWRGDGAIALIDTAAEERAALALGIPIVNISSVLTSSKLPRVVVDNYAIGTLAADHLLECGFSRFAYYGLRRIYFSSQRGQGFADRLARFSRTAEVFEDVSTFTGRARWHLKLDRLSEWLSELDKPCGVFACTDQRARLVLETAAELGLNVPDELAVLGVDNEQVTCEFSSPTITSIARNDEAAGYEAAALLDKLMQGGSPPQEQIVIPPESVVKRQSTNVLAVENAHLKSVVDYVQEHLAEPFG
ncbi:MAG: XylR family transcriptional regulator, partial [Rhodospirillales bacterium]|nr:XylR family transcriptional regulator [Rhodospirillales bacterium]